MNNVVLEDEYIGIKKALKLGIYDHAFLKQHNIHFIKKKLVEYSSYFDHLYDEINPNISLDLEQRIAILTNEDYNLIVAGAGSGKTTTMIGKIKYLVDKCNVNPTEILAISFSHKNVLELDEKLNKILNLNVKTSTFHQLGMSILTDTEGKKRPASEGVKYNVFLEYFKNELFKHPNELKEMVNFLSCYFNIDRDISKFKSIEEFHKYKSEILYESLKGNLGEYNKQIIDKRTLYRRTIKSEYVRSNEELKIANFLYLNNLDYEYEKKYLKEKINGIAYYPDFTITQGENTIYLEHFGINQNGTCLYYSDSGINTYLHNIEMKKQLHARNGTKMIATYSKFNDKRPLLEHLEELLKVNGFVLTKKSEEEIFSKIIETNIDSYFTKYIFLATDFISQFKLNDYNINDFEYLIENTNDERTKHFLKTIIPLYTFYQNYLYQNNMIDFEDMIIKAIKVLRSNNYNSNGKKYKYLIIDEYQDISKQRFELIKEFADFYSSNIIAVGDDWQSIFSFAGSNVELFTKFQETVGYAEILKITNTYRNAQELIDVAGEFVQKDQNNLKKQLFSKKHIDKPVCVYSYDSNISENISSKAQTLAIIISDLYKNNSRGTILLIGRYNNDIEKLVKTGLFKMQSEKIICTECPTAKIEFATVHRSKGLEYDNVILINAVDSTYGFPSKVKDDPIFELFKEENNSYAEERRLFYVALTRTKNKVYIIVPKSKPSPFVIELKENIHVEFKDEVIEEYINTLQSLKCPSCGAYLRKEYFDDLGEYVYACSSENELCNFKTTELEHKINLRPCPKCNGYLIFKTTTVNNKLMIGCTNYDTENGCKYVEFIDRVEGNL